MGGKYKFDDIPPEERKRLAEDCGLTQDEIDVFEMRARTDRVVPTAMGLAMSDRTVKRRCASIARKLARAGHHTRTGVSLLQKRASRQNDENAV